MLHIKKRTILYRYRIGYNIMNKQVIKMELNEEYLEVVKELSKFKLELIKEQKNQEEILQSENLLYTPDFTKNIENLIGLMNQVFNKCESLELESHFNNYHWFMNYDGLQDTIQYNLTKYLPKLEGLKFGYDNYYLIDETYNTIKNVDLDDLFTFYDTLCDYLVNEFMVNIENLDDIDDYDLRLENQVLNYNDNNNNGWYNLTFDNGTYLQSDSLHVEKFQQPLFSALIVKFISEVQ